MAWYPKMFFNFPNNVGVTFEPGLQPFNPGPPGSGGVMEFAANLVTPWPYMVPSITMMQGFFGIPRVRAVLPVVNRPAMLPSNDLFIAGFVKKSQG